MRGKRKKPSLTGPSQRQYCQRTVHRSRAQNCALERVSLKTVSFPRGVAGDPALSGVEKDIQRSAMALLSYERLVRSGVVK